MEDGSWIPECSCQLNQGPAVLSLASATLSGEFIHFMTLKGWGLKHHLSLIFLVVFLGGELYCVCLSLGMYVM